VLVVPIRELFVAHAGEPAGGLRVPPEIAQKGALREFGIWCQDHLRLPWFGFVQFRSKIEMVWETGSRRNVKAFNSSDPPVTVKDVLNIFDDLEVRQECTLDRVKICRYITMWGVI
jgi:hypothetical protein